MLNIKNYEEKLQRVRSLFQPNSEGLYNKNLFLVSQCIGGGSLAGFLIGGRIGARVGAVEHIENTTLAVYQSSVHAQREYQGRVSLGFLRNGCKFGWRAGVFAGLYSLLLVSLNEASNTKNSASSFMLSGALTGIVYKSLSGWRPMVVGAIIGSALSIPPALFTASINQFASDEVRERLSIFHVDNDEGETGAESQAVIINTDDADRRNDQSLMTSSLDSVIKGLEKSLDKKD